MRRSRLARDDSTSHRRWRQLVVPGVSPGSGANKETEPRQGRPELLVVPRVHASVARCAGSINILSSYPGLTPGATLCRHLRWLVERDLWRSVFGTGLLMLSSWPRRNLRIEPYGKRNLVRAGAGKQSPGVWGEFPIYLFRGLVRRILSGAVDIETGKPLPPQVAIDREELPLRRSLISQIIKQLGAQGRLRAIKPLANRDGCVNTIASLIGELQRAGKTSEEFQNAVEERAAESGLEVP